jgi:hypothetical protein
LAVRRDVRIGALMRPDHPLADVRRLTLAACFAHPVAVGKRELSIREAIEPLLEKSGLAVSPMLEGGSIRMLVELARIGHHVSDHHGPAQDGKFISTAVNNLWSENPTA